MMKQTDLLRALEKVLEKDYSLATITDNLTLRLVEPIDGRGSERKRVLVRCLKTVERIEGIKLKIRAFSSKCFIPYGSEGTYRRTTLELAVSTL